MPDGSRKRFWVVIGVLVFGIGICTFLFFETFRHPWRFEGGPERFVGSFPLERWIFRLLALGFVIWLTYSLCTFVHDWKHGRRREPREGGAEAP